MTDVEQVDRLPETLTVPRDLGGNYVLRVSGDGLECEQMRDGDFLIVSACSDSQQAQHSLADGTLVLVEAPDYEGQRVRRFRHATDSNVCLEIGNCAGIYSAEQVRIVGVIVGIIRKY